MCALSHFSRVRLFVTPWTVAHQAPLSMRLSREEYWSRWPFPFPGDVPKPGIKSRSSALQADSLPLSRRGSPQSYDHMELNDVNKNSLGSESVLRPSKQELGLPTISNNNFCSPELGALHGDCVAPLGFWQFVPSQEKTHLSLCESEC